MTNIVQNACTTTACIASLLKDGSLARLASENLPTFNEKLDYYENFLLMRYGHNKEAKEDLKKDFLM
ncbi:unnamed protein product [Euphydryas editha]|uniref:Uncharacterized protein n=1 Tax=Euphydryas editha TaxID=104508 RepID=A0AAU9UPZ4_EUPED|nr:unnamed protein product [Euphydryas editha]